MAGKNIKIADLSHKMAAIYGDLSHFSSIMAWSIVKCALVLLCMYFITEKAKKNETLSNFLSHQLGKKSNFFYSNF